LVRRAGSVWKEPEGSADDLRYRGRNFDNCRVQMGEGGRSPYCCGGRYDSDNGPLSNSKEGCSMPKITSPATKEKFGHSWNQTIYEGVDISIYAPWVSNKGRGGHRRLRVTGPRMTQKRGGDGESLGRTKVYSEGDQKDGGFAEKKWAPETIT